MQVGREQQQKRRNLALYRFVCQIFGIKKIEPKHMNEQRIQDLRELNEHVVAVMKSRRINWIRTFLEAARAYDP